MSETTIAGDADRVRIRWFRKWWFLVPLTILLFLLATFDTDWAFFVYVPLLIILWSGPCANFKGEVLRKKHKWLITGVSLVWIVFHAIGQAEKQTTVAELPSCESSVAVSAFKRAVKNSPQGKVGGLEVHSVQNSRQCAWDGAREIRTCRAVAYANSGAQHVVFTISWANKEDGEWWLELQPTIAVFRAPSLLIVATGYLLAGWTQKGSALIHTQMRLRSVPAKTGLSVGCISARHH